MTYISGCLSSWLLTGYEVSPISDPTTARPPEVDVITSDQVDSSPLGLHFFSIRLVHIAIWWTLVNLSSTIAAIVNNLTLD